MQPDQIIIELGDSAARIHISQRGTRAPAERTRIPLRPVALSPEGDVLTGRSALDRARETPEAALTDLLERIGDPSPCQLGDRSIPAEDLLTGALARPLSALREPGRTAELHLVLPAHWGPHVRERVTEAFGRVATGPVHAVATPVAVMEGALPDGTDSTASTDITASTDSTGRADSTDRAVVVDAGTDRITVTTLARSGSGRMHPWRIQETAVARFGLEDVDDALLTFVLARVPELPQERHRSTVRTGCRSARASLQTAPATTITLPGQEDALRLVRGDLDVLVGQPLRSELRRTIGRLTSLAAGGSHTEAGIPVIVIGEFAGQPLLVETVSSLLGRAVQVTDDPEYAAIDATARRAAAAEIPAEDVVEPGVSQWWKEIVTPQRRRRSREGGRAAAFPHPTAAAGSTGAAGATGDAIAASRTDRPASPAMTLTDVAPERPSHGGGAAVLPGRGWSLLLTVAFFLLLAAAITWLVVSDPLSPLLEVLAADVAGQAPALVAGSR